MLEKYDIYLITLDDDNADNSIEIMSIAKKHKLSDCAYLLKLAEKFVTWFPTNRQFVGVVQSNMNFDDYFERIVEKSRVASLTALKKYLTMIRGNDEQSRAWGIFKSHIDDVHSPPLHMLIVGSAGSGKSLLLQLFREYLSYKGIYCY